MVLKTKGTKRDACGKKRVKRSIEKGQVHISSTFNNTMVCLTDLNGNVLSWASAGQLGFRESGKSILYATRQVAEEAAKKAVEHGLKTAEVYVKGPGSGRESTIRSLQALGLKVNSIEDVIPIPHNGCRLPKKRGVQYIDLIQGLLMGLVEGGCAYD